MQRIFAIVVASTIAAPALAADLSYPVKAPPYMPPVFSWTGTYVGANIGGTWGTFDFNPATMNNLTGAVLAPGQISPTSSSVIGGFQVGYNWQTGPYVLGVESDIQFTGLKQGFTYAVPTGFFVPGDSMSVKTDYLSATRVKLGYAWDRTMIYAAGGLETGVFDVTSTYASRGAGGSPAFGFTDSNKFHYGYNVGAGVEYAVTNNVSLGAEYRYYNLGKETYNLGAFTPSGGAAQTVSSTVDLKASQVTARLNVKLNGLGLFGM